MSLITFHNIHEQKFFLRSSNLLVRLSKSTSSLPALLPSGILSGKFGKSVGTAGRSGKLGPDEGRGALGAGGWWGAEKKVMCECWIKHWGHESKRNDHSLKELLTVKQIPFVRTIGNV